MVNKTKKLKKTTKKNKSYKLNQNINSPNKETNFKYLNCNPGIKSTNGSCYKDKDLLDMKNLWNSRHPDSLITSNDASDIWKELKFYMSSICNEESCWLKKEFIKYNKNYHKLLNYSFAPQAPNEWKKNKNEWLSSIDINKVMQQWEKNLHTFAFLGPSPIDFDKIINNTCVWNDLCDFDLNKFINKNKTKIGIIFNLDPHYKSGSHWVSLFIDIKNKFIFFFDSAGPKCPPQIKKLANRIIEQGKKLNIDLKFFENHPFEHQQYNTECGMYSLYFTIELLTENKNPEYFLKHKIPDKMMEGFRNVYFNII